MSGSVSMSGRGPHATKTKGPISYLEPAILRGKNRSFPNDRRIANTILYPYKIAKGPDQFPFQGGWIGPGKSFFK